MPAEAPARPATHHGMGHAMTAACRQPGQLMRNSRREQARARPGSNDQTGAADPPRRRRPPSEPGHWHTQPEAGTAPASLPRAPSVTVSKCRETLRPGAPGTAAGPASRRPGGLRAWHSGSGWQCQAGRRKLIILGLGADLNGNYRPDASVRVGRTGSVP
jgi:hypothetical protein